jgi:CHRD domain
MKSRFVMAVAAIAVIAALGFGGTTLASHNTGSPRKALHTTLNGHNERSMTTLRRNAGDLDGLGSANVLIPNGTTVCFGISVSRIGTPTAAHIHRGRSNQNGPIVVSLTPPTSGNPGASSGCVSGLSSSLVRDIRRHPNQFYVNVHNSAFPNGAIRGQL